MLANPKPSAPISVHQRYKSFSAMLSFRPLALFIASSYAFSSAADAPPEVAVPSPQRGEIHRFVTLPGTLRANQQVTLQAKVAGYLKSISVDNGDTVKAGQLLAEIEIPELQSDRARHE